MARENTDILFQASTVTFINSIGQGALERMWSHAHSSLHILSPPIRQRPGSVQYRTVYTLNPGFTSSPSVEVLGLAGGVKTGIVAGSQINKVGGVGEGEVGPPSIVMLDEGYVRVRLGDRTGDQSKTRGGD